MTGIDPEKLRYIRDSLWRIAEPSRTQAPQAPQEIRDQLAAMSLDLNDDATYELLQDGLTKQSFDDLEFLNITYSVTRNFHSVQNLAWQQYTGLVAGSKHTNTSQLIMMIDHYLPQLSSRQLPVGADPYHRLILQTLLDDHASGKLQAYCQDLAIDAALEGYQSFQTSWQRTKEELQKESAKISYENFVNVPSQLNTIIGLVKNLDAPRQALFFSRSGTSEAHLSSLRKEMALMSCHALIKAEPSPIPRFEGYSHHHVYQYSVDTLTEAGVDMADPATYTALGMDHKIFWDNYRLQRDWINKTWPSSKAQVFMPPSLKP